jgi:flagellar biosynthesis protein FliR
MRLLIGVARALPAVWIAAPLGWPARLVLAALLTAIAWPAIGDGGIVTEGLIGLALGVVASVPFRAAQAAGATLGFGRTNVLGDAFGLFALALFAAIGGPLMVARAWGQSYALLPTGSAANGSGGIALATEAGAKLIGTAIALSLPALGALLLAELMAALLVKAQPLLLCGGGGPLRLLVTLVAIVTGMSAIITVLASGGLGALGSTLDDAARRLGRP